MSAEGVMQNFAKNYLKKHGEQPFHVLREPIMVFQGRHLIGRHLYAWKESAIDPAIIRMNAGGIIGKLISEYAPPCNNIIIGFSKPLFLMLIFLASSNKLQIGKEEPKLNLWHFSSLWLFCLFGITLSIVAFLIETYEKKI